jgi:hypothetical protein
MVHAPNATLPQPVDAQRLLATLTSLIQTTMQPMDAKLGAVLLILAHAHLVIQPLPVDVQL